MSRFLRPLVLALVLCLAGAAGAASTAKIAAIGDSAPGGGVFAGPAFTTWPAAGGVGWVAFRTALDGASAGEALVIARLVSPTTRIQVARTGDASPTGRRFRSFIGRPTVNGHGDVAFIALLTSEDSDAADAPLPAGVFVFRQTPPVGEERLITVAQSGDATSAGTLDLAAQVDPFADAGASLDVPQRAPALNDARTVAFRGVVRTETGSTTVLFVRLEGRDGAAVLRLGDPYGTGRFVRFGPPVLNDVGQLAFSANVDGAVPTNGIFVLGPGGLQLPIPRGTAVRLTFPRTPPTSDQVLLEFGDLLALDDTGAIAFTAGPIFDLTREGGVAGPGTFLYTAGGVRPILYPGQQFADSRDRVKSVTLGTAGRFETAPPALAADGSVVAMASLNGGNVEGILRIPPPDYDAPERLVTTTGFVADASPAGGTYVGLESAPVVDAGGGVAFRAHVAGGYSSQAIVYRPAAGLPQGVFVGEGGPVDGFFAGAPFSTPKVNDRGDVVFRGFVANGSSSVGLFRRGPDGFEVLVRSGDRSPLGGDFLYVDFPGDPSISAGGLVAFTATVLDRGRGVFVRIGSTIRAVAIAGDAAPGRGGAVFRSFGSTPSINAAGDVAFRATIRFPNIVTQEDENLDGVFLASQGTIQLLAASAQPSPAGLPFVSFRDPLLTGVPSLVFVAPIGGATSSIDGVFVADATRVRTLVTEGQDLGAGTSVASLSSAIAADDAGDVAIATSRLRPDGKLGAALLRRSADVVEIILAAGDRGPDGQIVKTVSQPAMNAVGHTAFRSTSQAKGGATGYLLATQSGIVPLLLIGDRTAAGGRVASFTSRATLTTSDTLAVNVTLSKAQQHHAIILASPTHLVVPAVDMKLARRPRRDRVHVRLELTAGAVSDGFDLEKEPIVVSLADAGGALWSGTVPAGALKVRGSAFVLPARRRPRGLRAVRVDPLGGNIVRVDLTSTRADLSSGGTRRLEPPLTVSVEVGDDSGRALVPCAPRRGGLSCATP